MRRAFTMQLSKAPSQYNKAEVEGCFYDGLAGILDHMLGLPPKTSSIRHDSGTINCYVGPNNNKMRIVRTRHCNGLLWTQDQTRSWCESVVAEYEGSPRQAQDGNRLPRPVEESEATGGSLSDAINKRDGRGV